MFKLKIKSYKTLKKLIKGYRTILKEDNQTRIGITWIKKLLIRSKGFSQWEYYAYNIDKDPEVSTNYVSTLFDYLSHPKNGRFNSILGHKHYLPLLLKNYPEHIPEHYYLILDNDILCTKNNQYHNFKSGLNNILNIIHENKKVICKAAVESDGGNDVYLIEFKNHDFYINHKQTDSRKLEHFFRAKKNHLITEYVHQHTYASKIFPHSANTIRILTIWDKELNQPFIAYAIHRFGNNPKSPVDNVSRGGGSSYINLQTGQLEKYKVFDNKSCCLNSYEQHPATRSTVEGIEVPNWETLKNNVLKMAADLPFLVYLGWDIICTNEGFKILEINSNPSIKLAQLHKPIVTDKRIDDFFRQNSSKLSLRFYRN